MAFKRTARSMFTRNVRRRLFPSSRMVRRSTVRFLRRRARMTGLTNRASAPNTIGRFRTRRIRPSTFRRNLWRSTQDKSHYRSVGAATAVAGTPATVKTDATLVVVSPGSAFWTAAGGAQPEDTGVAVPTFIGDIVLRGGVSRLCVANRTVAAEVTPTDNVRVTIFTVWTNKDVPGFAFPGTVPISWDPSVFPDFQRHGRVIGKKEAILSAGGDSVEVYFRHRIQRIDQNVHNNLGSRLQWFILLSETTNSDVAAAEVIDITNSINYSFTGDAQ